MGCEVSRVPEICDACNGSGFGVGDNYCGKCGGCGGIDIPADGVEAGGCHVNAHGQPETRPIKPRGEA